MFNFKILFHHFRKIAPSPTARGTPGTQKGGRGIAAASARTSLHFLIFSCQRRQRSSFLPRLRHLRIRLGEVVERLGIVRRGCR